MDGGARETLCSSCSHINVCVHKDDYLTQNMNIPENADAKNCAKMIAEEARNLGRDMKQNLY